MPNAPVTAVVFLDYMDPFSPRTMRAVERVRQKMPTDLRYTIRLLPSCRYRYSRAPGDQQALPLDSPDAQPQRSGRARWGWLFGHVFLADVEHCTRCGGPMRWLEAATSAEAIARLLAKHGLAPRPPPPSRSAPIVPGQLSFAFARSAR